MDAVSDIPVLVRLPNLGEQAADVQATVKTETLQQEVPASPPDSIFPDDGTSEPPQSPSRREKGIWLWSDFRVPLPVAYAVVAFSLIASVVAYAAIFAGPDASHEMAEGNTAAEGGEPPIARGLSISVSDDAFPHIDFASSVPEIRNMPVVPFKGSRQPKKRDTRLPPPQPFDGEHPPASKLENALSPQQADEPAMVTKYQTPNVLRRGDWNEYMIRCRGRRVQLSINGHQTIDYSAPQETTTPLAVIGLRIHVGPASETGDTELELIGKVAPCELSVPSGLGTRTLSGTFRPFPSQSPCFGGNQTCEQNATRARSEDTGRPADEDVGASSIRFVENPTQRLTVPCRRLDDATAPTILQ